MAHAVEMDDVHKNAKVHAGAVIVPALLTVSSFHKVNGKDFITALVIGYEIITRIGNGINAKEHRIKGWHATGTCGTFGAAASVAKLWNFTKEEMVNALGLAGTQSSGLWAFTANGANSKMFHAGSAAANGILSAVLVKGGLTGSNQILEAEDGGFFRSSSDKYSFDEVISNLGERFFIIEMTRKPYACCRSMHPPIEAALRIKNKIQDIENIEQIIVSTYEVAKMQCGFTKHPKNVSEAKFSIPYGVAVAIIDGQANIEQFTTEKLQNHKIHELASKVEIVVDKEFDDAYPDHWGCKLTVRTKDDTYIEVIKNAKGDPENPLTEKEIQQKFIDMSGDLIGFENCEKTIEQIQKLESINDVSLLIDITP